MSNKKEKILVTIITVVYNGEHYLQQTIESVKNQSYTNIEYIIVDGGSTDGTLDIIKANEDIITFWVSEPDNGLYDAMNKGIDLASGELIGMINSDDWYEFDAISSVVDAYKKQPRKTIFHANLNYIYENGDVVFRKYNPSKFKFKYYGMTYNHPTFFVKKIEYDKHKYNIKLKSLSDYQFSLEVFLEDNNKFYYIDKVISNFRVGGISDTLKFRDRLVEGYVARRNAKMKTIENILSIILRFIVFLFYQNIFVRKS